MRTRRHFPQWWLTTMLLVACASSPLPGREGRVVVSASAEPDYHREIPGQAGPRLESYTFAEGRFFPGRGLSTSLTATPFLTIARTLAVDLAKQEYWPATVPEQADLLLMVHWGITNVTEPPDAVEATDRLNAALADVRAAEAAETLPYLGELNERLNDQALVNDSQARRVENNARLLGYNAALTREAAHPFGSASEQAMRADLAEERYFVIVMAYDYRLLREHRRKDVRWIARMSLPARGQNFFEALPALSRAGGGFFGQRHPSLQTVRVSLDGDTRRATAEIGELKVVEETSPIPPE